MWYTSQLAKSMYQNALDGRFTDFRISAGSRSVDCHQVVVSAQSEFFNVMCCSGLSEAVLEESVLSEENAYLLGDILKFMYLGKADLKEENVEIVLFVADFIKHGELKNYCESFMIQNLSSENLVNYQALAQRLELPRLPAECLRFRKDRFPEIVKTSWFLELPVSEMQEFLEDDCLNVESEDIVVDAVLYWLQNSTASGPVKEGYLENLFQCIRLRFCSREKLEAVSRDPEVMDKLRLKILEYLQHGLHGDQKARKSYTRTAVPDMARQVSSASISSMAGVVTEEKLIVLGGRKAGVKRHKDIILFHRPNQPEVIGQMPAFNISLCTVKDSIVLSGGCDFATSSSQNLVKRFSLATRCWTDLTFMPEPTDSHGSAYLHGKLYTIGGSLMEKGETIKRYSAVNCLDLASLTWTACEDLPLALEEPGVAVVSRDIMVIGGDAGDGWSTKTFKYSTRTGKWKVCAKMPKSGDVFRSTVAVGLQVYVLNKSAFMKYDVMGDQWTKLTPPTKLARNPALAFRDGRLVALGGVGKDMKEPDDNVQTYDVNAKKWTLEKRKLPLGLSFHWALVMKVPLQQ
jgi:kelch repeat/BTB domain-containing protein 5/10